MSEVKVLINEEDLQKRIKELAKEIEKDYGENEIVVLSILRGAAFFTVDLTKRMNTKMTFEFMQLSSYIGRESSGEIKVKSDISFPNIKGKDVLIVEDIIDTGRTMNFVVNYLKEIGAKSVKVCTLLNKKERREVDVDIDYIAFEIPDEFVYGYGLDYDEYERNLPYIVYKVD